MTTKTPGQKLDEVIASTRQEYDEAKLKIHLANMELKDEWGLPAAPRQLPEDLIEKRPRKIAPPRAFGCC